MGDRSRAESRPSRELQTLADAQRCRLARRTSSDSGEEQQLAAIAALLLAAEHDSSYFSPGAMMACEDVAIRTGHLSALVGKLACAFNEHGTADEAVHLALSRIAACAIAWLEEMDALRRGSASR